MLSDHGARLRDVQSEKFQGALDLLARLSQASLTAAPAFQPGFRSAASALDKMLLCGAGAGCDTGRLDGAAVTLRAIVGTHGVSKAREVLQGALVCAVSYEACRAQGLRVALALSFLTDGGLIEDTVWRQPTTAVLVATLVTIQLQQEGAAVAHGKGLIMTCHLTTLLAKWGLRHVAPAVVKRILELLGGLVLVAPAVGTALLALVQAINSGVDLVDMDTAGLVRQVCTLAQQAPLGSWQCVPVALDVVALLVWRDPAAKEAVWALRNPARPGQPSCLGFISWAVGLLHGEDPAVVRTASDMLVCFGAGWHPDACGLLHDCRAGAVAQAVLSPTLRRGDSAATRSVLALVANTAWIALEESVRSARPFLVADARRLWDPENQACVDAVLSLAMDPALVGRVDADADADADAETLQHALMVLTAGLGDAEVDGVRQGAWVDMLRRHEAFLPWLARLAIRGTCGSSDRDGLVEDAPCPARGHVQHLAVRALVISASSIAVVASSVGSGSGGGSGSGSAAIKAALTCVEGAAAVIVRHLAVGGPMGPLEEAVVGLCCETLAQAWRGKRRAGLAVHCPPVRHAVAALHSFGHCSGGTRVISSLTKQSAAKALQELPEDSVLVSLVALALEDTARKRLHCSGGVGALESVKGCVCSRLGLEVDMGTVPVPLARLPCCGQVVHRECAVEGVVALKGQCPVCRAHIWADVLFS